MEGDRSTTWIRRANDCAPRSPHIRQLAKPPTAAFLMSGNRNVQGGDIPPSCTYLLLHSCYTAPVYFSQDGQLEQSLHHFSPAWSFCW